MKVSPKTNGAIVESIYECSNEVSIGYRPGPNDPVARVVEFPKVWRMNGKQYNVYSCSYYHNGDRDDKVTVKGPTCHIYGFGCDSTKEW
jgi:hypothetical protein